MPKARPTYALFASKEMEKSEYTDVRWKDCAKIIAAKWKALSEQEKAEYRAAAKAEKAAQLSAVANHGLPLKTSKKSQMHASSSRGGVTPGEATVVEFGPFTCLQQRAIGQGSYGRVVLAKETNTERRVALKLFKDGNNIAEVRAEIKVYDELRDHGRHHSSSHVCSQCPQQLWRDHSISSSRWPPTRMFTTH